MGVIGLGYVGLPLAVEFAKAGLRDGGPGRRRRKSCPDRARRIVYRRRAERGTPRGDSLGTFAADDRFLRTCRRRHGRHLRADPTAQDTDPDLTYVVSAVDEIARHLRAGQLVILESTTYPGTVEEVVRPKLETGGLRAGRDFYLAFSPERVDPGNEQWTTRNIPKVVGGSTTSQRESRSALYEQIVETVVPVSSTTVAEMVKLLENTFRAVNIGLANELALMCRELKVDVWEVIDAAKSKPLGYMPFYPGPGLGGHCIPIDPFYLSWKANRAASRAGSSIWPGISTRGCPGTSSSGSRTHLTVALAPSTRPGCTCSAWRTNRTSATSGNRHRSTSRTCCDGVVRCSATVTRSCQRFARGVSRSRRSRRTRPWPVGSSVPSSPRTTRRSTTRRSRSARRSSSTRETR